MLQAHYRSTLDFSNEALQAAEKGMFRLFEAMKVLEKLEPSKESTLDIHDIIEDAWGALCDDLNSPVAIARLFDAVRFINLVNDGSESLNELNLQEMKDFMPYFVQQILGLKNESTIGSDLTTGLIDAILNIRMDAKRRKDFETSDRIREMLSGLGIEIRDTKDGVDWKIG